jgi:predicted MPP superfamily phosphohydrolase
LRIVLFLVVSAAVHLFAARWLLAVSPWARKREKRVRLVAIVLSTLAALLRVISYAVESYVLRVLMAFALVELAVVLFGLVFAGIFLGLSRLAARIRTRVSPPKDDEEKAARVTRREAIERVSGAVAFGGTGLALGWGIVRGRHAFGIEEVVVKIPNLPKTLEGYTIAQVSDVHVGAFVGDRELDEGFELVRRVKPDLVVATGDLVDSDAPYILELAKRMLAVDARDGAFGILGNHDHYAGPGDVVAIAKRAGFRILNNESVVIRDGFALVGLDDLVGRSRSYEGFVGPDLARALAGVDRELPRILLAHQPNYFVEAAGRVALQLSGHTHGGQINPGFRPADLVMRYVAGRYVANGTTLWVNRGFGTAGPPTRVGAPPEVTKIVLTGG